MPTRIRRKPQLKSPTKDLRKNEMIRIPEVMVIDNTGNNLGAMQTQQALQLAQERGLDLVEVSPLARPPVCRILDYGTYKYQQEKQQRKSRAKQKKSEIKAVRLTFKIGKHDWDLRLNQSKKFLEQGNKVKIEMVLRGRENAHKPLARERIHAFIEQLGDADVEQELKNMGNRLSVVVYRKTS